MRICCVCSAPIGPERHHLAKTCSDECSRLNAKLRESRRHHQNLLERGPLRKICVVCGSEFLRPIKRGSRRLTCSDSCQLARQKEVQRSWQRRQPKKPYVRKRFPLRECRLCGSPFYPLHSRNFTCGKQCSRRASGLKRSFGLEPEQYRAMLERCNHSCESCGVPFDLLDRTHHVDHCHETGKVRGLLCQGCNVAAGHLGDDPSRAIELAKYLERVA